MAAKRLAHEAERNVYRIPGLRPVAYQGALLFDLRDEPADVPVLPHRPRRAQDGRERRDRGISRVSSRSPFVRDVLRLAAVLLVQGERITGEELRERLESRGLRPHHPNGWGAAIHALVRRGMLVETGRWLTSKREAAHARRNAEYLAHPGAP